MSTLFKSDTHKFLFVHIPKTGGTSVKAALNPYTEKDQLQFDGEKVTDLNGYRPHLPLTPEISSQYRDYYKFVCIRNPWSWHASIWKFAQLRKMKGLVMPFPDYIADVCNWKNRYSPPQSMYFSANGKILTDGIIRFENITEDFQTVCNHIGLENVTLGHFKNQGSYDYRNMYTKKTYAMIKEHCKEDILAFGWKY